MKLTQTEAEQRISSLGLTLVSEFKGTQNGSRVDVKCKCGKIFNVSWKHISSQHTKSCGCLQRKNLIGQRFGRLVVIQQIPKKTKSYNARWWLCKCDCGNFTETITHSLTNGSTFTCGCSRFGENSHQWKGYKCISGKFWSLLKHSAQRRHIKVEISKEYAYSVLEKQKFTCALTGVPIQIHVRNKSNSASIDRIDSTKGYVNNNIQWVHKRVNKMKMEYDQKEFIDWCKKVVEHSS